MISWILDGLEREEEPQRSSPFDIKTGMQLLIIPVFVNNNNHSMLCVARLADANNREGKLDWYESSDRADCQYSCKRYATDVVRVLLWLATNSQESFMRGLVEAQRVRIWTPDD